MQGIGEFILTHPNIKIPSRGKIYSFNEGNSLFFQCVQPLLLPWWLCNSPGRIAWLIFL
jgi:hypothetical protein